MSTIMQAFGTGITIHASVRTRAGLLAVRDPLPGDAEAYVNYWHYSGDRVKNLIGIDPKRLGTPEDSRQRFLRMMSRRDTPPVDAVLSIVLNDELIGYTNINWYGGDESYAHLHVYRPALRSALKARDPNASPATGIGLGAALIGLIGGYFDLFPIRRLVLQTRTTNYPINRALALYLPPAETTRIDNPAGLAAPGEFEVRYVYPEDVPWIRRRAEFLGASEHNARRAAAEPRPAAAQPDERSTPAPADPRARM